MTSACPDGATIYEQGMNLRDYFAAAVVTGYYAMMSRSDWAVTETSKAVVAREAYNQADALLKQREIT